MGLPRRHLTVVVVSMLAAASLVTPSAGQGISEQAKAQLTAGEQLLKSGDLVGAQTELQKVITDYQTTEWTWWARVRLSECYYHQKRFDDCILEARKVVNLFPAEAPQLAAAWAQLNIALAFDGKGDKENAIWEYDRVEKVLGDDPDRGPALAAKRSLALVYHQRNERKKSIALAKEILKEAKATAGDQAWAFVILGSALVGDKKFDEGFSDLKKVKDDFPGLQEQILPVEKKILENRYIARHNYDGAIKEAKSIILTPGVSDARARQARYFTALSYLYKRDCDEAIAQAQELLDKYPVPGPDHFQMLTIKARAYAMKKDYAKAIVALEAAVATGLADAEQRATVEWDIATCYRAMGDTATADTRYQRLIDMYPESHLALRAKKELSR